MEKREAEHRQRLPKYVDVTCWRCGKQTRGMGFWMTRVYSLHRFSGATVAEIYELLPKTQHGRITRRYIRELLDDFVTCCSHCHEPLIPTGEQFELYRLRRKGATLKQLSQASCQTVYMVKKKLGGIAKYFHPIDGELTWAKRRASFPPGWFGRYEWSDEERDMRFKRDAAENPLSSYAQKKRRGESEGNGVIAPGTGAGDKVRKNYAAYKRDNPKKNGT